MERIGEMRSGKASFWVLLILLICWYLWRLWLIPAREFGADEFEHTHAAWSWHGGMLPYRDFFEHHTPLLYVVLSPVFMVMDAAKSIDDTRRALFVCRAFIWLFSGATIFLTVVLGKRGRGWMTGLAAGMLLIGNQMFLNKSVEIRPDSLSTPLLFVGLYLLWRWVERGKASWWAAGAGLFIGLAVLTTQKVLFVLPGVGLALAIYLVRAGMDGNLWGRLKAVAWWGIGFAAPWMICLLYFGMHGCMGRFLYLNFVLNAHWKIRFSPTPRYEAMAQHSPLFLVLAGVGFAEACAGLVRRRQLRRGEYVLPLAAASVVVGSYIVPVPYEEYFMMLLPLMAVFAGRVLVGMATVVARRRRTSAAGVALTFAAGYALCWIVETYKPWMFSTHFPASACWAFAAALAAAGIVAMLRWRYAAVAAAVVGMSVYPLVQNARAFDAIETSSSQTQLRRIGWVMAHTKPTATVMDGWQGFGVFRPHAWYYFFPHAEIQAMLTENDRAALLADVESGRIHPSVVVMDGSWKMLYPPLDAYLLAHYHAAYDQIFYVPDEQNGQVK